jgi:hypothetical protein
LDQNFIDDINFSPRCGSKVYCTISQSLQQNHAFLHVDSPMPLPMAQLTVAVFRPAYDINLVGGRIMIRTCGELDVEL